MHDRRERGENSPQPPEIPDGEAFDGAMPHTPELPEWKLQESPFD